MSREQPKDTTRAEDWLQGSHPLPPLEDLSLEGRRAFLEQHEDTLWYYWSKAFSLAIASGSVDPRRELGAHASEPDPSAREIAERLITALREKRSLDEAKPWENVEGWYAWLIGAAAARARLRLSLRAQARGHSEEAHGELFDLHRLLDRWLQVLKSLVDRTGVRTIELDWLWATHKVRKQLPEMLGSSPESSRLVSTDLQAAIAASSVPGPSRADRIARTRAGAGACIRFNIEELATRTASPGPLLTTARKVFVGPASSRPPYPPQTPIDDAAVSAFEEAWNLSQRRAQPAPGDGRVESLWKGIFRCGVHKAALRILPRKQEEALRVALSEQGSHPVDDTRDEP